METMESLKAEIARLKMIITDRVEEPGLACSQEVSEKFAWLRTENQEHFVVGCLDNKHRVLKTVVVTKGTLNQSLVHPREVFAPAVEIRAAAIVILHNHPSGDTSPSNQDIAITQRLIQCGEILGIKVIDSLIIAGTDTLSFADDDLM